MIILFSKGCPSPLPLPLLRRRHRRRCPAQATTLHAIGVGSRPCGKRCCPRVAPRGRAVPPCAGAAPAGAVALAGGSPGRGAALCRLATGSHSLWPGRRRQPIAAWPRALPTLASVAPAGASHARGRSCILAVAPARGFGCCRSQPAAPCSRPGRGWPALHGGWPWLAAPPPHGLYCENAAKIHPDGEDEGGQASSSLAVSTRWISTAKLLESDLATLAQREGGE
ncbi:hypothetical protein BHE74_00040307 [Ensete ventricosum]|nr:hypothetical protein BHE74_00040307 [Ensete ventricosum]